MLKYSLLNSLGGKKFSRRRWNKQKLPKALSIPPSPSPSPCFPYSYGVYCRDNVSVQLDRFPNCTHLNTQPAAPSRTHCINKLHWGLISQGSQCRRPTHTHTHTHLIRCDSQSFSTEKSPYSTELWVKVNNFTKADRFSSLQRDGDGDGKKEKVIITAKEGFWEQKKYNRNLSERSHRGQFNLPRTEFIHKTAE